MIIWAIFCVVVLKVALDQGELALRLVSEGKSVREIAPVFNVHPATIYRLAYSTTGMVN